MKQVKIAALLLALLLMLTGCGNILAFLDELDTTDRFDPHKYLDEYENNWQYSLLDDEIKLCYGSLYTAVTDTATADSTVDFTDENGEIQTAPGVRVRFSGIRLNEDDITSLFEALSRDNPQFFFLERVYRMEGHRDSQGTTYYDTMLLQYHFSAQQRLEYAKALEQATTAYLSELPNTTDHYLIELSLHDQLNRHCSYDTKAAEDISGKGFLAYTAYGALVNGSAVCEGYARAMQLLLHRAAIPATVINGKDIATQEAHMWNLVKINGKDYYLDSTWNDNGDKGYHSYFNITSAELERTHIVDAEQRAAVDCTATEDNYFVRNDTYVDTYERQVIAKKIAARVQAGDTLIQLRFSPEKLDNGLLFLKNGRLTFELVNGHLAKHDLSLWNYQLWVEKEIFILTLEKA